MNKIVTQTGLFGTSKNYKVQKPTIPAAPKPKLAPSTDNQSGARELGTFETIAMFKNRSVTQVDVYRRNGFKKVENPNSVNNLLFQSEEKNAYNGYLSPGTTRMLRRLLEVWMTSIELNVNLKGLKKQVNESQVMPTFVTLTLPSVQIHADNDIKSHMLHPFLHWLKQSSEEYYQRGGMRGQQKGFGVKGFFWRAEPQKNGNIHFHILVDRYVPWDRIRQKWNEIIENHGYVTRYGYVQKGIHKNGFVLNKETLKIDKENLRGIAEKVQYTRQMPKKVHPVFQKYLLPVVKNGTPLRAKMVNAAAKEKQKKAYEEGVKCGWTNPNTTDIHGIQNLQSVADYVVKYVTKKPTERPLAPNQEVRYNEDLKRDCLYTYDYQADPESGTTIKTEVDMDYYKPKFYERKINGRLWGCADILRGMKIDKNQEVKEDENGFKYTMEKVENPIPELPFDKPNTDYAISPEQADVFVKKPFYEMKYFTKTVAERLVLASSIRDQGLIYTNREIVSETTQNYLEKLTAIVGENTVLAISSRVGDSFERMGGRIIPLEPEKMGFKPIREGKKPIVKHVDILKKYAPELHQEYIDYHAHIFNCLYGNVA